MEEIKLSDYMIKKTVVKAGLEGRKKALVVAALSIYMRKYRSLTADRLKGLLRDLKSAELISSYDFDRLVRRIINKK